MLGPNRFRRDAVAADDQRERRVHNLREHLTLWVMGLSFVALVATTILTQFDQASSSRDMQKAIDRLGKLAASSGQQVKALRDQDRTLIASADAAKSQAQTARKQVEALRQSLSIAQQSATASRLMAVTAQENFKSERAFRQSSLNAALPILLAEAEVSETPTGDPYPGAKIYFNVVTHNTGPTAGFLTQMMYWIQPGNFYPNQGIEFPRLAPLNKLVAGGGEWKVPSTPLQLKPQFMPDFLSGKINASVAFIFELVTYTGQRVIQCYAWSVNLRPGKYEVFEQDCPTVVDVRDSKPRYWHFGVD